jgi:zeaxanthin epoxidase
MMPNLGQGGCQAVEDGFVLSGLLADIDDKSQIKDALQEYYRQRIVRSAIVQGMSRLSSDIIISAFSTPFKLSEFLKEGFNYKYLSFPSIMTWNLKSVLPLIFYAQFGYLYSFAPSSFTSDFIKDLVNQIQTRHKLDAGNVYKFLKEGYITYFTAKQMAFMQFNTATREVTKIADATEMRN